MPIEMEEGVAKKGTSFWPPPPPCFITRGAVSMIAFGPDIPTDRLNYFFPPGRLPASGREEAEEEEENAGVARVGRTPHQRRMPPSREK